MSTFLKSCIRALVGVAPLVAALSHMPGGCGFGSWSGPVPGLQVRSPAGVCARGH